MTDEDDSKDDDDSRTGQHGEAGADAPRIGGTGEADAHPAVQRPQGDGVAGEARRQGELTAADVRDLRAAITEVMAMGEDESWSGMLPMPAYFNAYPKDVQERMCRWNDAATIDESKRQDRLVDNEIAQSRQSMWISAGLFAMAMVLSLVCFIHTRDAWSFGFLAVPVVSMIGNMLLPVFSHSSTHDSKQKTK